MRYVTEFFCWDSWALGLKKADLFFSISHHASDEESLASSLSSTAWTSPNDSESEGESMAEHPDIS